MLDQLESLLEEARFLDGDLPGEKDREALSQLGICHADPGVHPNVFGWLSIVRGYKWAKEIQN